MTAVTANDVTVVILAGGRGQRMGGQDKGLVPYKRQALIEHVIAAMRAQTDNILINANRNLAQYAGFGYPVIEDTMDNFQGPLAGFLAAMNAVNTRYILTLPCDGPVIVADYLQRMLQALNTSGCDIAVASDGHRMQPVYALIPVALKTSLQQFLEAGERKIDIWYAQHSVTEVEFDADSGLFTNMNTPDDLKKYG